MWEFIVIYVAAPILFFLDDLAKDPMLAMQTNAVLFGFLFYVIARDYGIPSTTFRRIKRKFSKSRSFFN